LDTRCRARHCAVARGAWHLCAKRKDGGANRDRTDDLKLAKLALSQLSYGPVAILVATAIRAWPSWPSRLRSVHRTDRLRRRATGVEVVGLGRLELPTSRLSSARSNQLSYKPDEAYMRRGEHGFAANRRKKEGKRRRRQGANCLNVEVWEILVRGPETIDP
jgi:hypothetical protein